MPQETSSSPKRDVEVIRQKNLEDNQIFLEQLLMTNIRNDFVSSARSILPSRKPYYRTYEKVERATRYNENVKSGRIPVHVPEWQRLLEEKNKETELRQLAKERKKLEIEQKKQEYQRKREELLVKREQRKRDLQRKREELLLKREQRQLDLLRKREEKRKVVLERQQKIFELRRIREEKEEEICFEYELRKIEQDLKFEEKERLRREKRLQRKTSSKLALYLQDNQMRVSLPRQAKIRQ